MELLDCPFDVRRYRRGGAFRCRCALNRNLLVGLAVDRDPDFLFLRASFAREESALPGLMQFVQAADVTVESGDAGTTCSVEVVSDDEFFVSVALSPDAASQAVYISSIRAS